PVGGAPKGSETGDVFVEMHRIVAPVTGSDHPPVEVEDALQLASVESGQWMPVPLVWKRRDYTQALFAFGAGARLALSETTSALSAAISSSISASRARPGSQSSPQGVP